jgi:hypothetical protein
MTSPYEPRHVEVKVGEQTVAAAEVTRCEQAGGTVRTSLYPSSGHIAPGSRAGLVDSVLDLPEVRASARLKATVPLGDARRCSGYGSGPGRPRPARMPRW